MFSTLSFRSFSKLFAILMAFTLVLQAPYADARKFGGGKSFGKTYQTAPAHKRTAAPTNNNTANKQQSSSISPSTKGMFGGLLGGLLAGGLFASLFSGGGFSGFQLMDFIILAGLAFILFKVFKAMNRSKAMAANHRQANLSNPFQHDSPANNSPFSAFQSQQDSDGHHGSFSEQPYQNAQSSYSQHNDFNPDNVPMNLPSGFNLNAFLNGARDHYRQLQQAWNMNDLAGMQSYLAPELFQQLKAERATLHGDQHTEVMFVDAELARADYSSRVAELSIRFSGKYRDTAEGIEEPITDIWHLQRDLTQPNAPWLIVGIEV